MAISRALRVVIAAILFISILSPASFASCGTCDEPEPAAVCKKRVERDPLNKDPGDALRKLGRGASNLLTFPLEVPYQISKTNNNDGPMAAYTYGLMKGLTMGTFRALVGAYEILSFPIPLPEFYRPILTDPEFMLEDWYV